MTPGGCNTSLLEIPPPPTIGAEHKSRSRSRPRSLSRNKKPEEEPLSRYGAVNGTSKSTSSSVFERRSSNALQSLNPDESHVMKIVKYGSSQPRPEYVTRKTVEIDADPKMMGAAPSHTCAAPPVIFAAPSYIEAVGRLAERNGNERMTVSTGFSKKKKGAKSSSGIHVSPLRSLSGSNRRNRSKSSTATHTFPRSKSPSDTIGCVARGRTKSPVRRARSKSPSNNNSNNATPLCQSLASNSLLGSSNNNSSNRPKRGRSTSPRGVKPRSTTPPPRWNGRSAWSNASHIKTTVAGELAEKWEPLPPRPSYKHRRPKRYLEIIADDPLL